MHVVLNAFFFAAGDGPKRLELLQMRDKYDLHDQVELLGAIRPGDVRSVSDPFEEVIRKRR